MEWRKQLEGSGRTSLLERKHGVGKGLKVEVGGRTRERDRRNEGGRRAEGKCRSGAVVVVFVGLVEDLAVAASGEVIAALDPKLTKSASPDPPSAATAAVAGDGETLPDGNGSKSQTCGKCELDTERASDTAMCVKTKRSKWVSAVPFVTADERRTDGRTDGRTEEIVPLSDAAAAVTAGANGFCLLRGGSELKWRKEEEEGCD